MSHPSDLPHDAVARKLPVNLELFSHATRELIRTLTKVAEEKFGEAAVKELEGSVSVSVDGKVIAKLLPQEPGPQEYVLLGISSIYCPQDWRDLPAPIDGPFLVRESPFHFLALPRPVETPAAVQVAEKMFDKLLAKLGTD